MTAIVRGASYPVLVLYSNGSIKYRDPDGYVNFAILGEYRLVNERVI